MANVTATAYGALVKKIMTLMKDNTQKTIKIDTVFISGRMERFIKVLLKMILSMEKGL